VFIVVAKLEFTPWLPCPGMKRGPNMLLVEMNPVVTIPHHGENRLTSARTPAMIPGMFTLPMLVFNGKISLSRGL